MKEKSEETEMVKTRKTVRGTILTTTYTPALDGLRTQVSKTWCNEVGSLKNNILRSTEEAVRGCYYGPGT